jgi:hypothetical protein
MALSVDNFWKDLGDTKTWKRPDLACPECATALKKLTPEAVRNEGVTSMCALPRYFIDGRIVYHATCEFEGRPKRMVALCSLSKEIEGRRNT